MSCPQEIKMTETVLSVLRSLLYFKHLNIETVKWDLTSLKTSEHKYEATCGNALDLIGCSSWKLDESESVP